MPSKVIKKDSREDTKTLSSLVVGFSVYSLETKKGGLGFSSNIDVDFAKLLLYRASSIWSPQAAFDDGGILVLLIRDIRVKIFVRYILCFLQTRCPVHNN